MQHNGSAQHQQQPSPNQQTDIYSYPLPIRIKHPSWSARKGTYEQLLYYLKTIHSPQQQIIVSGTAYTVETLLPYFENLIHQKHASVLLKGLECVEQILTLDKKAYSKHCIKSLVDKGIQFFPLLSQQRKAILQKFLDILELSKIQASFLKNKLNLPHQKSVMYVIQVIGVLNMTSLKTLLSNLSKKHQKKCVRQLAAQIAQELEQASTQPNSQNTPQSQSTKPSTSKPTNYSSTKSKQTNSTCKYTIQKLPHYEQLPSKKQQQFSSELAQKIDSIIEEYTFAQLPNFSHILRLMIDDNNHIINVNAIKCLIAIFDKQKDDGLLKNSLIPVSFPLLFMFSKFKSHKTHPINFLMLSLIESILQSSSNRVNDLFQAICEGLSSAGSKANVKFGCGLAFFRIISLLYKSQDLYKCTVNENMENENEDMGQRMGKFESVKLSKNLMKVMQKIMSSLEKDKKYETEMYLIKYAIGLDLSNLAGGMMGINGALNKQVMIKTKLTKSGQQNQSKNKVAEVSKNKKNEGGNMSNEKTITKKGQIPQSNCHNGKSSISSGLQGRLAKSLKEAPRFEQINLQQTLNKIIKLVNIPIQKQRPNTQKQMKSLLQRSQQQFYQCVKQKRFEMFYLCELLQHFIQNYEPNDTTIERVSEYLISLLKIVSLLKPLTKVKQISLNNVSQLLLVALCKLVISEEIHEVLENIHQNYGFQIIFQALEELFVHSSQINKMKKKNKKYLLQWLEANTPALQINKDYYQLIDSINEKNNKKDKEYQNNHNNQVKTQGKTNQANNHRQIEENHHKIANKSMRQADNYQKQSSYKDQLSPKKPTNNALIIQPQSSAKKNQFSNNFNELQNINLSKIQKNITQSNDYYDQDMQKSSFHQNIEQHLKHIRTHRSYEDYEQGNMSISKNNNTSRQYLKHLQYNREELKFRKKGVENNEQNQYEYGNKNMKILQSSPFKSQKSYTDDKNQSHNQSKQLDSDNHQTYDMANKYNILNQNNQHKQEQNKGNTKIYQEQNYQQKLTQVQKRRLERERQRKEFINRMKHQFKPVINTDNVSNNSDNDSQQQLQKDSQCQYDSQLRTQNKQDTIFLGGKEKSRLREYVYEDSDNEAQENTHTNNYNNYQNHTQVSHQQPQQHHNQSSTKEIAKHQYNRQAFTKLSPLNNNYLKHPQSLTSQQQSSSKHSYNQSSKPSFNHQMPQSSTTQSSIANNEQTIKQQRDCSFISSTSSGQFKYRQINHQKLSYMLKSTSNPYQHLRNLILIPFKSSHKKHQFLKELLHFLTNHVQLKMPQPYTSLILLIILMFSQIKQDKTLIQPLQSLYEFMAKQSTTNDFIKTIINLFHTVIEQTLPQNRKFLITILLKSMIRMLPFIEDGLSLLRDIQQFYQIGEMVYFQMFQQEYTQIRNYIEEEAINIVVEKALQQQGKNLVSIVEGWLGTQWKHKVTQVINEFQTETSGVHEHDENDNNHEHQDHISNYQQHNYQSYI